MLLTSCELKPHPRVPNSSGVQQGQRCSAFGPRRKLRQGSCLNYLTFAHLYFYLLASLVARCLQKKVNPSTQTGAPTKQNSQNSHDKHAHANLNIYIYTQVYIYIYTYITTEIRNARSTCGKITAPEKHKQLPALKFTFFFFLFR